MGLRNGEEVKRKSDKHNKKKEIGDYLENVTQWISLPRGMKRN